MPASDDGVAVVYSHGWGGRRDAPQHADVLDRLQEGGIASIALDQRGYGETHGEPDLAAWPRDMGCLVGYLRDRGFERVWTAGLSTGGSVAIVAAAVDERVHGTVALSPFASLARVVAERPDRADFLRHRFGGLGPEQLAAGDALAQVGRLAPRPLLIVAAADDAEFSPDHARALHAGAAGADLWLLERGGHTLTGLDRPGLLARLAEYIARH